MAGSLGVGIARIRGRRLASGATGVGDSLEIRGPTRIVRGLARRRRKPTHWGTAKKLGGERRRRENCWESTRRSATAGRL